MYSVAANDGSFDSFSTRSRSHATPSPCVNRMCGAGWMSEQALLHKPRPERERDVELGIDGPRLADVHLARLRDDGRVVGLAERRVSRPGVVPLVGRLRTHAIQLLDQADVPLGLQELEHDGDRRAHDATADNERVDILRIVRGQVGMEVVPVGQIAPASHGAAESRHCGSGHAARSAWLLWASNHGR